MKTIDNEAFPSQEDVVDALNGADITPASITTTDITANLIDIDSITTNSAYIKRIAYLLEENNFLSAGTSMRFNQTLSSPSLEIFIDTNNNGAVDQTYSIFGSEVNGEFRLYDTTNTRDILNYNPSTESQRIQDAILISDTTLEPTTDSVVQLGNIGKRFENLYIDIGPATGGGEDVRLLNGLLHRGTSDERLKKDITSIPVDWTKLNSVNPSSFKLKTSEELESLGLPFKTGTVEDESYCGFIAQNVNSVYTDCARVSPDGMQYIDQTALLGILWTHVKDLEARVKALEP